MLRRRKHALSESTTPFACTLFNLWALGDSLIFLENESLGKRRFSQETAETAGTRRKPQIGVCPLRFVPLSTALEVTQE